MITNPNGANQYKQDPRQRLFWEIYLNPSAKNFSNAYQAAMEVGYTEGSASQITAENWFLEKHRLLELASKAERNINKLLDSSDEKVKLDISKFVVGRLKKKDWSERMEMTGANGDPIIILPQELISKNKLNGESVEKV